MQRVIDYIKSWAYYPKMEKYFDEKERVILIHGREKVLQDSDMHGGIVEKGN